MIIVAISAVFETTKERLELIFKNKILNSMVDTTSYFRGLHPSIEIKMQRPDVVSGCIEFLADVLRRSRIKTNNFYITIESNSCTIECITGAYTFPKIIITNFRSQFMRLEFEKCNGSNNTVFPESAICNYSMIGLAEALSKYYLEVYNR